MQDDRGSQGPIMRVFAVQAKPGCVDELMRRFASTSADVVRHEPGNKGYVFGRGVANDNGTVIFASLWDDLAAVQVRFGAD